MHSPKVLITGINGFMGSSLESYIKKEYPSWDIYGIDKEVKETEKKFRLDIVNNRNKLKSLLVGLKPRYIFHLAGANATKDLKRLLLSNVYATYILLKSVKEIRDYSPRIITPASAAEYGKVPLSEMPIKENTPLNPVSLYGFSKMMQTKLSLMLVRNGLDIIIARVFNVIGRNVPTSLSIGKFAFELALIKRKKKKPKLYTKNLESKRDFLDIRDVCRCLLDIALYGNRGEVYNVCRGKAFTIKNLLIRLIKISGIKNIKVIEDKNYVEHIKDSFGSTRKLKKFIKNFRPISIDESLRETFAYYLSKV